MCKSNPKRKQTICGYYDDESKEKLRKAARKRMDTILKRRLPNSSILKSKAFEIIQKEYLSAVRKGPDYICNIYLKYEYWETALIFDQSRYEW